MPGPCGHFLYPSCRCPAVAPEPPVVVAVEPVAEPVARAPEPVVVPEPVPPPRRTAAPPWSPNYRDPKTGEYPNRVPKSLVAEPTPDEIVVQAILDAAFDPAALEAIRKTLSAELARVRFSEFCRQAWHVIEPSTKLVWGWHHELLCNVLQGIFETWDEAMKSDGTKTTPIKNCVINCPPNSLKSKLIAVFWPVWIWLRAPGAKLACISVNEKAAHRDARAARDLIRSKWFQSSFSPQWSLKGDQDAIGNYGNTGGGERLSIPSGSVIAGLRGDFLIGDDLNDPADAGVESEILKVNDLWDSTQYSRTNDPLRSIRLCVQQRLRSNDHTGHVLSKQGLWSPENPEGWLNVVLSAEFDERKFVMPPPLAEALVKRLGAEGLVLEDTRTEPGQSIDPIRMPKAFLAAERVRFTGTGSFAGQMLQRPALVEGARIKRNYWGWFRLEGGVRDDVDELETGRPRPAYCLDTPATVIRAQHHNYGSWNFDWVALSVDCALKETKRGSNWGLLAVAGKDGRRYVLDDRTRRGDILEIIAQLREMVQLWRPSKIVIEDKAAGDEMKRRLIAAMSEGDLPMVTVEMIKVSIGKEERLDACISTIANGMVSLLDGAPWLEEFVDECAVFPFGSRDDRPDALTQILNHIPDYECDEYPDM